jgi:succinate dehydrogenase / fumarate reductase flavoprotein subunit
MRIYPAVHYTMGGLWVDYDLQSMIPGLFVIGEANFSDHGANRLGASALMQGLADGYFVLPTTTIGDYLAGAKLSPIDPGTPEVVEAEADVAGRIDRLLSIDGDRTVDSFHRELGHVMWDYCGMERSDEGLRKALDRVPELRREFWSQVKVPGSAATLKPVAGEGRPGGRLPRARRADVPRRAAPHRELRRPSRAESQTDDGEALRDDEHFSYAAAWEYTGQGQAPVLHKEDLVFEYVTPSQRSYK